eukprot:scaffold4212_cov122-Isochrysis_galbana.AAC.2
MDCITARASHADASDEDCRGCHLAGAAWADASPPRCCKETEHWLSDAQAQPVARAEPDVVRGACARNGLRGARTDSTAAEEALLSRGLDRKKLGGAAGTQHSASQNQQAKRKPRSGCGGRSGRRCEAPTPPVLRRHDGDGRAGRSARRVGAGAPGMRWRCHARDWPAAQETALLAAAAHAAADARALADDDNGQPRGLEEEGRGCHRGGRHHRRG